MKYLLLIMVCAFFGQTFAQDIITTNQGEVKIHPINHATLVLEWDDKTIYVDPNGDMALFEGIPSPDLILITDIHGDHFNKETLEKLDLQNAEFIVPAAVQEMMEGMKVKKVQILGNGEQTTWNKIQINAIPMYNLPESADARHTKGRGNGYVLTIGGKKIYISGDTEDIPEMRQLQQIDVAFVCMNLPYTMSVEQAADAVLAFKPKIVYPYHYRGGGGQFSDVEAFKNIVESKNNTIEVRLRDWY